MVIKSGYSHSSEPTLELHSRAVPGIRRQHLHSVGPIQEEIPEEGRSRKKNIFCKTQTLAYPFCTAKKSELFVFCQKINL